MLITVDDYFGPRCGHPAVTPELRANAEQLLKKVNLLLLWASGQPGIMLKNNEWTGTLVSGSLNGCGDGGWRPPEATTGTAQSKHRIARAVDIADANGSLDKHITDMILAQFGLYREHPAKTLSWCHLQDVAPGSGKRTYWP